MLKALWSQNRQDYDLNHDIVGNIPRDLVSQRETWGLR